MRTIPIYVEIYPGDSHGKVSLESADLGPQLRCSFSPRSAQTQSTRHHRQGEMSYSTALFLKLCPSSSL